MSTYDPYAAAVEEAERGNYIYGQIEVAASAVVLKKGQPKRTWIEGHDEDRDRSTEISFIVNPLEETGLTRLMQRSIIASNRGEWAQIVWPSLRDACGVKDLRTDLDKKFVKVEFVKNGRKWTNKTSGEEQEGTTFKFHAVYSDQASCVAAYVADGNEPRNETTTDDSGAGAVDMSPGAGNAESQKETARAFLTVLVKQANGNKQTLADLLADMPMITKYFSVDSPEVGQMMSAS